MNNTALSVDDTLAREREFQFRDEDFNGRLRIPPPHRIDHRYEVARAFVVQIIPRHGGDDQAGFTR